MNHQAQPTYDWDAIKVLNREHYNSHSRKPPTPNWNMASPPGQNRIANSDNQFHGSKNTNNGRRGGRNFGNNDGKHHNRQTMEQHKEGASKSNSSTIYGTRSSAENSLAGQRTIRNIDIFVGGLNNLITEDLLANYLIDELYVEPVNIVLNKNNGFNQSYKVTIKSGDKDKVMCPSAWENNIIVKPFRNRRTKTIHPGAEDFVLAPSSPQYSPQQYDQHSFETFY